MIYVQKLNILYFILYMNYKYFIFFTQFTNSFFMLEELPLLFKKLNSKECQTSLISNIQEQTHVVSKEDLFNTNIQTTQTITVYDNIISYKQKSTPVEESYQPTTNPVEMQKNSLTKSGKASFYFRVENDRTGCPLVQTFNDGKSYGPCNNGNGVKYNGDSETKYWVAIKNANLYCGQTITISYQTNSIKLKVMDKCPSCSDYDIDMSLDALIELTGSVEKACSINTTPPIISWDFN